MERAPLLSKGVERDDGLGESRARSEQTRSGDCLVREL
jgi:hypothetical protein